MLTTERIKIEPLTPDPAAIRRAVQVLGRGGLVAIPTETVYGLAANGLDADAVNRIFEAKGRPAINPIILHVSDSIAARSLVRDWPTQADLVANIYWPGPVTLILPRNPAIIPDRVTAGGPTVALRAPSHPVAQAILKETSFPLAAPSANRSEAISPTTADHVLATLDGRIDLVLDSGPTEQGLESTVVDLTTSPPRILRPGPITRQKLESILGPLEGGPHPLASNEPARSPGMLSRHYAPKARVILTDDLAELLTPLQNQGKRVHAIGWLARDGSVSGIPFTNMPTSAEEYGRQLYAALHEADRPGVDVILIVRPPDGPEWEAIHDRLKRAATPSS